MNQSDDFPALTFANVQTFLDRCRRAGAGAETPLSVIRRKGGGVTLEASFDPEDVRRVHVDDLPGTSIRGDEVLEVHGGPERALEA